MGNIDTILLSGVTYAISDSAATKVVDITQNDYDNLPSSAKTANILYNITDATAADLSQYWTSAQTNSAITQAVSGKVDSNTYTAYTAATDAALSGKQDTLSAGTGIDITNNVISATGGGGGGKAVSGGTNISITTGETADTINCTIPLTVGSSNSSLSLGIGNNLNSTNRALAIGDSNTIANSSANSLVGGMRSSINYDCGNSIAFGYQANVGSKCSCSIGGNTKTSNNYEAAFGRYNASNTGSTDADKTLFSVGNSTDDNARHNALEIRQNGDIYITLNGQDVKLQDILLQLSDSTT